MKVMYTQNPYLPRVRRDAAFMAIRKGVRLTARHFGVSPGTVSKWVKKARKIGVHPIPTISSKPKRSPLALSRNIVQAIIEERSGRRRCAEVIHQALMRKGVIVSLSSVKRTLDRCGLLKKRSPWKRPHDATPRPEVAHIGALLQADTVHIMAPDGSRIYVYTIIDLYSRWAYAEVVERIGASQSVLFLKHAQQKAPFRFEMVQTDHGSEFSIWFTHALKRINMSHRHSRVRQSNDNAHIERFNRTIQEECLDKIMPTIPSFRKAIPTYLEYYNSERLHMGINYKTPLEMFPRY
jgi:transposase InsO family protein